MLERACSRGAQANLFTIQVGCRCFIYSKSLQHVFALTLTSTKVQRSLTSKTIRMLIEVSRTIWALCNQKLMSGRHAACFPCLCYNVACIPFCDVLIKNVLPCACVWVCGMCVCVCARVCACCVCVCIYVVRVHKCVCCVYVCMHARSKCKYWLLVIGHLFLLTQWEIDTVRYTHTLIIADYIVILCPCLGSWSLSRV